jgi:hypothetical protein
VTGLYFAGTTRLVFDERAGTLLSLAAANGSLSMPEYSAALLRTSGARGWTTALIGDSTGGA